MDRMKFAYALLVLVLLVLVVGCGARTEESTVPAPAETLAASPTVTIIRGTLAVTLDGSGSASLSPSKIIIEGLRVGRGVDIPVILSSSEEQSFTLSVREIPDYTEDGYNRDIHGVVYTAITPGKVALVPGEAQSVTLSIYLLEEVSNVEMWFSALSDKVGKRLELCLRCLINPEVGP